MICSDCRTPEGHAACKERNKDKQGADCDCLHRVRTTPDNSGGQPE